MTIAPEPGPERPHAPWRRFRVPAIAAGVVCLVAALSWFTAQTRNSRPPEPQASSQVPLAPKRVPVRVHVENDAGPLPSAHVRVRASDDSQTENVTDASGNVSLHALEGPVRIEVNARGQARSLTVADAQKPLSLSIRLEPERVIVGKVLDDRGEPLEGAKVHAQSLLMLEMSGWDTTSDAEGRFRVPSLPRHELSLEVVDEGHEGHERVLGESYDDELVVVLARQGELEVTVRNLQGAAVEGARLFLTGPGLWPAAEGISNGAGSFLFTRLSSGEYRARGYANALAALPSEPIAVTPGERAHVELLFEPGARLCGVVVDARGAAPIAHATISVFDPTPGIPARVVESDAAGKFELAGLYPGEARLEVLHGGFAPLSRDLRLGTAPSACAPLPMQGAASVSGVIVDERGIPIEGALVSVSTREGLPVTFRDDTRTGAAKVGELGVTTGPVPRIPLSAPTAFALGALAASSDAGGAFRIEGLVPSPLALHVARSGYAPATLLVEQLSPHEARENLALVLRTAGRIEGRLTDRGGRGVPGVYLAARGADLELSAITNAEGDFLIADVLGEVSVEAMASGYAPVSCHVQVAAKEVARCALALDSTLHELAVRVEDERGFPLSGALVSVRGASSTRAAVRTSDASGAALVRELPEPPYLVDVTLAGYLTIQKLRVEQVGRELRLNLQRAGMLSGVVTDVVGRPVRGAFVSTDEGDATTESDVSGKFTLRGVAPGVLTVWAKHKRAGEGESSELRARPGEHFEGARIVLDGRYVPSSEDAQPLEVDKPRETPPAPVSEPVPSTPLAVQKSQPLTLDQRGPKVLVSQVASGSLAEKAGMRAGDVLLTVDGETVFSAAQARGMLRDPPGSSAAVRVSREGRVLSLRYRRESR